MFFGILGPLDVRLADGEPVSVGGPRVRALLALLLLNAGRLVGPERLIDGLYGENPPAGATNALQSQISRLRRGLAGADGPVEFHPAGYRLAVDPDDVDAHRFERLAAEGRQALTAGDHRRATALLGDALGLWRGPALTDLLDAPFAAAQATRLEERRLAAVEDRAEAELALGEHDAAVTELREPVAAHPLREKLCALFMRALYGAGRQAEALAVFEKTRRRLADELGADPSADLAEAHLTILRGTPGPTLPARPPAQLTSFVGREEELRRIGKQLAEARLVTLTGPGGAGKTRLAIEASTREHGEVGFVDLSPVGEGAVVPAAVLGALGIGKGRLRRGPVPSGPADPVERLSTALTGRPMLLVLDNCEHVIDAVARLAGRLLGACPDLRVLATSREALGITGESLRPVPPLGLPPPQAPAANALGYPSVRLFADRAAAVRPGFRIDDGTVAAVRHVCIALDGLPLAIELAAARLRSLPIGEIATRLDDRFKLLSRGDRTKAPRHQTLRAVVEWSWSLLEEDEQVLARRLTVFSGGATLEAAERVCGLPEADTADLLAGLADKSLVEEMDGRYRMLDTIRAFCAEQLAEAGEEGRLRRAHATYFRELMEGAEPHLRRAEQLEWLDRLRPEHGNLEAALRWATHEDPPLGLRLLAATSSYWWLRGLRGEGVQPALNLIEALGSEPPAGYEEDFALCLLLSTYGVPEGTVRPVHREQVMSIMHALPGPARRPMTTLLWALTLGPSGSDAELENKLLVGDPWTEALLHVGHGYAWMWGGRVAAAEREFAVGLTMFRALGERWGTVGMLIELARLACWRGERDRFLRMLDEALNLVGLLGSAEDMADVLCLRAEGRVLGGDLAAARADLERAADLSRRAGAPEKLASAHHRLGRVARLSGDLAGARRLHELALSECASDSFAVSQTRAYMLVGLGEVAEAEGDAEAARARYDDAIAEGLAHGNIQVAADAAEGLAGVALIEGDGERAALLLGVARSLRGVSVAGDPDVARLRTGARALAGDAVVRAAYDRGAAMGHDAALAEIGAPASALSTHHLDQVRNRPTG